MGSSPRMPKTKKTYLARLATEADKLFHGPTYQQYAAICYRPAAHADGQIEILLITTRDSGRWAIPKGWPMDNKQPHEVAEREAWEEAGVKGKAKKRAFGFYTYLKTLDGGGKVPSVVQVHLVEVKTVDARFPEKGQRSVRWLLPNEAAVLVREPELQSLLRRVDAKFRKPVVAAVAGRPYR